MAVGEFLVKIKPYISSQDESRDESARGTAKEELTDRTLCTDYYSVFTLSPSTSNHYCCITFLKGADIYSNQFTSKSHQVYKFYF